MGKFVLHLTIFLFTFTVGVIVALNLNLLKKVSNSADIPMIAVPNLSEPSQAIYSPNVQKIIYAQDAPVKIVDIHFVNQHSPTSDMFIEVENISSKKIIYISLILAPFNDCEAVNPPGSVAITFGDKNEDAINHLPNTLLKPHHKITLKVSRKLYAAILSAQKRLNCPGSAKSALYLYEVEFSSGKRWNCFGHYPDQ